MRHQGLNAVRSGPIDKIKVALDIDRVVTLVPNLDFQVLIKRPHATARFESKDLFYRRIHDGANEESHSPKPLDWSTGVLEYWSTGGTGIFPITPFLQYSISFLV
jgi:hypothetical protein